MAVCLIYTASSLEVPNSAGKIDVEALEQVLHRAAVPGQEAVGRPHPMPIVGQHDQVEIAAPGLDRRGQPDRVAQVHVLVDRAVDDQHGAVEVVGMRQDR